jgi:uncharacterized protein (TIGR02246 family)
MKPRLILFAALLAATTAGGAEPGREVTAVVESLIAADNARDVERVLSHYTDDALFLPPNREPYGGKPALRDRYTSLFAANEVAFRVVISETEMSGALAFVRGEIVGSVTPLDRSKPATPVRDKFLMVLRRQPDSGWKVARLMWGPVGT